MKTLHQEGTTEDSSASTNVSHLNINQTSLKQQKDSSNEWSKLKAGGCWIKNSKKGEAYLSGSANLSEEALKKIVENGGKLNFHIYKNAFQEGNQPTYNFYIL